MKIGSVDLDQEVLVIAEIGNNHEGDLRLAYRLIELAADAGAQAVKFQTIEPERLVAAGEEARLVQLSRFAFTRAEHEQLARAAEQAGVMFLSTPFFLNAVEWLEPLVPAFKIASGDNDFSPLLRAVAETDKPVILSTGMTELDGVQKACRELYDVWSTHGRAPGLVLLQCVTSYPTAAADANVGAMSRLAELADAVGYSDHTLGIETAAVAVAAGARVIEKHFTISKSHSDFRDHQLSADPTELRALVKRIKEVDTLLGDGNKRIVESETATAAAARRSIVARRNMKSGSTLNLDDLDWLRPAGGLSPSRTGELVGRKLVRDIRCGERLTMDAVD